MTPENLAVLIEERDALREEVASLSEQVKLVVRAEHALTRSRRAVDRQLQRIRRLGDFALSIAGGETVPAILEQARAALLDFFELEDVVLLGFDEAAESPAVCTGTPTIVDAASADGVRLLGLLGEREGEPRAEPVRFVVSVPLCSGSRRVALLVGVACRAYAHHRDVPREEHLPFLDLFASHVTRALDNAALTAELRRSNQQLQVSLQDLERAQSQLLQAQKLDALGRLAGGIAHDFNNLLTLMLGAAQLLRPALGGNAEAHDHLDLIVDATKRATGITRRLLAFGRQQEQRREPVDLSALTADLSRTLRSLLGERVRLTVHLAADTPPVFSDTVHLEQILMNLAINARDAMPEGGELTLEARRALASELPDGAGETTEMVCLRVSDTGTGMDEAVRSQLFEPFFSTKPVGKGTGLGLSTVYGLVSQNGGHISVRSSPGRGATFTILLPIAPGARSLEPQRPSLLRGRVLLVDDEEGIRRVVARTLRKAGYEVHAASDGQGALALYERFRDGIDVVVTDVVMPGVGGPELVARLRATRPALPVVFMSGHTFDTLDEQALSPRLDRFLAKPFAPDQLTDCVEQLLDEELGRATRLTEPPSWDLHDLQTGDQPG